MAFFHRILVFFSIRNWRLFLVLAAAIAAIVSLFYTNYLIKKLGNEERKKVELWASTIKRKAEILKQNEELFELLKNVEKGRMELLQEAIKGSVSMDEQPEIYQKILYTNTTIPVVLVDAYNLILDRRNTDTIYKDKDTLNGEFAATFNQYPPLVVEDNFYNNQKYYIYYQDSKVFIKARSIVDTMLTSFMKEVLTNSASVPVIITNTSKDVIYETGNIPIEMQNDRNTMRKLIANMESQNKPISVDLPEKGQALIFYEESYTLQLLRYYPYFMLIVVGLFIAVAYITFGINKKAEQEQLWVGMAKETAHQLGTPLSSLIAWVEFLKLKGIDHETIVEIQKDVSRLETITDRFSKIGSTPVLTENDLMGTIHYIVSYIKARVSKQVEFTIENLNPDERILLDYNPPLFEWVIENLLRNAVDAMEGKGKINISVGKIESQVQIDITDTGKGIPKNKFNSIFEPGFTTKKRGWGLGLSLAKRIIEDYHKGKIFVKSSEIGVGTTFRIILVVRSVFR